MFDSMTNKYECFEQIREISGSNVLRKFLMSYIELFIIKRAVHKSNRASWW